MLQQVVSLDKEKKNVSEFRNIQFNHAETGQQKATKPFSNMQPRTHMYILKQQSTRSWHILSPVILINVGKVLAAWRYKSAGKNGKRDRHSIFIAFFHISRCDISDRLTSGQGAHS